MRGAWFLAVVAFFATTETGCKVKERTAVSTASKVETASEAHRDSVRVVYRDRVVLRTDTLTVREVVKEYGAPVLAPGTGYFTPILRETSRETESGARTAWQERADSLMQAREDVTFREDSTRTEQVKAERTTDDKSGIYIVALVLGAIAIGLYFSGKQVDKWKFLD